MKILRHRKHDDGSYELAIELDAENVREFEWAPIPPKLDKDGKPTGEPVMGEDDYVEMQLREAALLIEDERAAAGASDDRGEPLASEGKKLKLPE